MTDDSTPPRSPGLRVLAAFGIALAFALGSYALFEATQPVGGLVSFSFLLILPATICGFISYVTDPLGQARMGAYMRVPFILLGIVIVASVFVLREGTICVLLLSPLWLGSGTIGAYITYRMRRRDAEYSKTHSVAFLVVPLLAMQVEPMIPLPVADAVVTRSIVIAATPARIWPMLRGIPDVRPDEGRWNVTQDVLGVPRPMGARLAGDGIGADRLAVWDHDIRFRERIVEWQPGRRIGWRFIFDDIAGWGYTDRHLMPDSPYFTVTRGGYTLTPLADGRTRVTIDTRYRLRTPVNLYSRLWGELFLGDLENNLLAIIKTRAEHRRVGQTPSVAVSPAA